MSDLIDRARSWKSANNFSLYAHKSRRWVRKVGGKLRFFGPITEDIPGSARAALDAYLDQKDDLQAGRKPRAKDSYHGLTVRDACNAFCIAKRQRVESGELAPRTLHDYKTTCERIIAQFGATRLVSDLTPADFEALRTSLAKTRKLIALGNEIQRVRTVFKHAHEAELIDAPVRYGRSFDKPTRKALRIERGKKGEQMFEAAELRTLLDAATPELKAMMLLALNAGFGNNDCSMLPITAVNLETGWISFPRPKTGVDRRCPLWPETVAALEEVLIRRKKPKDPMHQGSFFVTYKFGTYARDLGGGAVSKEFNRLCKSVGSAKVGRGFYTLRHVHRTIADGSRDQPACDAIMGHVREDMASKYRERIDDARLKSVVDQVRSWLFSKSANDTPEKAINAETTQGAKRKLRNANAVRQRDAVPGTRV